MCSEEKIIDLIANRDESGMRELMERYQRPLMKLAMNMLDSEEDARECVNDTFYEVWKSVPDNRPQYLFAYSATICRHIICKRIDHDNALKRSSNVIELTAEMEQCIGKPDKALEGDEHMVGELINTFLKTLDTDKRNFYIELTIKSKDGSPIIPNDDTLSPIIGTFDFADTVIKISDETDQFKSTGTLYHLNYNGMSDDGSEIYAELIYVNADSRDIVNHNISIDVKDLKCTYRNGEDNKTRETRTLATGEWSFETVLKSSSTGVLSTTPNISVTSSCNADQTINIDTLKCDGFVLDIYGTGNADFKWFGMSGKYAPVVHLKDGTVVSIDNKTSDLSAKAGIMHISFALKQVISVDNIASIEWHGVTIYSAE